MSEMHDELDEILLKLRDSRSLTAPKKRAILTALSQDMTTFQQSREAQKYQESLPKVKHRITHRKQRFNGRWSGIVAGVAGVAIATFGYFGFVETHTDTTNSQHRVTSASNASQTLKDKGQSNATKSNTGKMPQQLLKPISSTDKAHIRLLKQYTPFKAITPSLLPKGYGQYKVNLLLSKDHTQLVFNYRGADWKTNAQSFGIAESPTSSNKIPAGGFTKYSKSFTIGGTKVVEYFPKGSVHQYWFVTQGIWFQVHSTNNSTSDTMKFLKGLINRGLPWN